MSERFDAIVVGAGFAGSVAAIQLAKGGANVLLVEQGASADRKSLGAGWLFGDDLSEVLPGWEKEMPLERHLVEQRLAFLDQDSSVSFDFRDPTWDSSPHNATGVLRSKSDPWLLTKTKEAGVHLASGSAVERLSTESNGSVKGVELKGQSYAADVTVLACGSSSSAHSVTLISGKGPAAVTPAGAGTDPGVFEVYRLDAHSINERFGLRGGQGVDIQAVLGFLPGGVSALGSLITHREVLSISLCLKGLAPDDEDSEAQAILTAFREHPFIAPYLVAGTRVERGEQRIPTQGPFRRRLFGPGFLVCGDAGGFVLRDGLVVRGLNYAIRSGRLAAETALEAIRAKDAGATQLGKYRRKLERAGVFAEFSRNNSGLEKFLWSARLHQSYPHVLTEIMHRIMTENGLPKKSLVQTLREVRRATKTSRRALANDALDVGGVV